ncbi:protein of unassigned function [Methylobacterium oryzae CBMB20]|uniref:Protein of unassigned function n=1 Tax=Methylobacterium oryzae CBMB20 TaxID=693986 RepID=A0A089NVG9_9HYPH|nr:protein of unassigned function [Methylobacterium oryzae CBMB20]
MTAPVLRAQAGPAARPSQAARAKLRVARDRIARILHVRSAARTTCRATTGPALGFGAG